MPSGRDIFPISLIMSDPMISVPTKAITILSSITILVTLGIKNQIKALTKRNLELSIQ